MRVPALLVLGMLVASCGGSTDAATPTDAIPFAETTTTDADVSSSDTLGLRAGCETIQEIISLNEDFDTGSVDEDRVATYITESIRLRAVLRDELPAGPALSAQNAIEAAEFIGEVARVQDYELESLAALLSTAEDNAFDLNSGEHALAIYATSRCELDMEPIRRHLGA